MDEETMIRSCEHVCLPVVFRDAVGENVEVGVEVLVVGGGCERGRSGGRERRVVLGMDFWGRRGMEMCWDGGIEVVGRG